MGGKLKVTECEALVSSAAIPSVPLMFTRCLTCDVMSVCTSGSTCSASSVSTVMLNADFLLHSFHTQEVKEVC